jgi:hypothetical protein
VNRAEASLIRVEADETTYLNLALAQYRGKKTAEALATLQDGVRAFPRSAPLRYRTGRLLLELRLWARPWRCWTRRRRPGARTSGSWSRRRCPRKPSRRRRPFGVSRKPGSRRGRERSRARRTRSPAEVGPRPPDRPGVCGPDRRGFGAPRRPFLYDDIPSIVENPAIRGCGHSRVLTPPRMRTPWRPAG